MQVMADIVMAYIVMACIVMTYIVRTYLVMVYKLCRQGCSKHVGVCARVVRACARARATL